MRKLKFENGKIRTDSGNGETNGDTERRKRLKEKRKKKTILQRLFNFKFNDGNVTWKTEN